MYITCEIGTYICEPNTANKSNVMNVTCEIRTNICKPNTANKKLYNVYHMWDRNLHVLTKHCQ